MNIDIVYLKELSLRLLPLLISGGAWLFLRWLKGYDSRRRCQFDRVSDVKRLSVLSRIQKLRDAPQSGMTLLQIKALYESIGIRLPVWVAHQLMDYLGRAPVTLSDLALNCFLRRTSLTASKDEENKVFALDVNQLCKQRFFVLIFFFVSALAIAYGVYTSVLPLGVSEATASNLFLFSFFFFAYLFLALFVVAWSINEWGSLQHAKAFWLKWQPHLCQNEAEYQARCRLERNVTVQEKAPDTALATVADLSPTERPLRGWLMRRLGKKDN
ncbi:hypothetical protein I5O28_04265 [Serratia marcescens]|jgi:hypothetical protein|uniref:hypothetical protein n=1 Tax=Serratia TaxID=613 RepID=UPI0009C1B345|nr:MULTISPECIES: hypothetical protein [Serratia]AQT65268.1 hypothetical protein B0W01_16640 [Serratia marcescens]MBH3333350.1 hypothetical protein [Serratia marcescens]MDI3150007.1 hypothetical protein [Serratia nevei]QHC46307.1 hypothetical protein EFZ62_15565 [Serratia marcescens]QHC46330.1 hypothetical protein EFZ62_15710 [Serratia marcescens]